MSVPPPAPTVDKVSGGDEDPASSPPTGEAGGGGFALPGWALGRTPISGRRDSHFHTFEGTKRSLRGRG